MTFSESVRTCLREKYVTFSGRASRSEYWWFFLFFMIAYLALIVVMMVFGGGLAMLNPDPNNLGAGFGAVGIIFMILIGVFVLAMLLPSIAVAVRRLHDRNMSGWWYLGMIVASIIPVVGFLAGIAFIVLMCLKGTDGPNKFGPDPLKGGDAEIFS